MRLTRVLNYLNWLIGVALLGLAAAVYWYAWRPLPKTRGEIRAPLTQAASITRDDLGIPHIRAGSVEDALFLQGYTTAQDRLWQMETLRRYSGGELSEILGTATIELDRDARRLRMRRIAREHAKALPDDDRKWVAAYARGVNHFIDSHRGTLPLEFRLIGLEPRPWTIEDCVVIGLQMYRDLTSSWKIDLTRAALQGAPNSGLAAQLFPVRTGLEFQPGSNAWAVSGKHTLSGKPILANDPHLEWNIPSPWHMIHLQAPGFNVTGTALAGFPAVIIGHNERIAWGITNLHFDVQDLYLERLDLRTGQYAFAGKVEQARPERELIYVKGGQPVEFSNWVTRHGPLWNVGGTQAFALRWTAAEPGRLQIPFVELNQARNWTEFRAALQRLGGPAQNFAYADVDGNIGYQATGILPVRRNFSGAVPVDGASGEFEWDGFAAFEDLPSTFNPPSGVIVTANQNPFPSDWRFAVNGDFDPGFRARQIRAQLTSRNGWKPGDMLALQKDVYSGFMHRLAQALTKAADKKKPQAEAVRDAMDVLRSWNGQMEKGSAAPMIVSLVYQQLRADLMDRTGLKNVSYEYVVSYGVLDRLLRERPKEWFSDWDAELMQVLHRALEEGRRLQGRNVRAWDHGEFLALELKNPVITRVPWVGKWFDIGPVPMSGSTTTIKQTSRRLGPSMRFVADLSDWNRSLNNITVGESGHILSSHYKDQWDTYWSGQSYPMKWDRVEGSVLTVTPER